jgi:biopolymer transport protein ExbB/TolQ/archaellum component FlaC
MSNDNHNEHHEHHEGEYAVEAHAMESITSSRPSTDANFFFQLVFGAVATVVLALAVTIFKGSEVSSLRYINDIINDRGWVQYGELMMSFMVVALMILKSRIVKNQLQVMASNPIPVDLDLGNDEQLHQLRDSLMRREEFGWSIILNRLDRAINLWLSTKDVSRVSTWASAESTRDTSSSDSSYSLCRVLIWAIPILGFIGTVLGLAVAVSGFGVLGGSAEIGAIKEAIGQVTLGLGVAFDTTLLALLLTVFLMFPLSFVQRNEENFFVDLDNYIEDMFISRLPSADKQGLVIEGLQDSIEAAFRRYIPDPERYDQVFTQAIHKAAVSVEEKFGVLAKNYESALKQTATQLSSDLSGLGDGFSKSVSNSLQDLQKQDLAMVEARKKLAEEEKKQVAAIMDGVSKSTQDLVSKSTQTAQQLSGKLDEVAKLAHSIQDLLQIEKSVEKSLAGISASDDFRKTLEDLRKHINSTTEFCSRLSKPRVITLREEVT